ncbi:RNA chaperone Hfq [Thermoanaerobacter sp. YS13]|uniref:RNA chaperone Hfq n=1 Tax=Thermoanaerobacter sp. YS13 TaxID=1511746 RepID=UPI0009F41C60
MKLQNVFLSQVRKEKVPVIIYLLRGIPLPSLLAMLLGLPYRLKSRLAGSCTYPSCGLRSWA